MKKELIITGLIISVGVSILLTGAMPAFGAPSVSQIFQGGTGTSTLPAAGNLLVGNSSGDGYIFIASSTLGGAAISSSSAITVNHFPFWASVAGGLSGSSTLTVTGSAVNSSGTISMNGDLVSSSTGANPSASVGLTAVNGSANTFLRSDGAPLLSQSIVPTWTGLHIFNGGLNFTNATGTSNTSTISAFSANFQELRVVSSTITTTLVIAGTVSGDMLVSGQVNTNTLNVTSTSVFGAGIQGTSGVFSGLLSSDTLNVTSTSVFGSTIQGTAGVFTGQMAVNTLNVTSTSVFGAGITGTTGVFTGLFSVSTLNVTSTSAFQSLTFTTASGTALTASGFLQSALGSFSSVSSTAILFTNATGTGNLLVNSLNVTNANEYRGGIATFRISSPTSTQHASGTVASPVPATSTITLIKCSTYPSGGIRLQIDKRVSSTPTVAGTNILASDMICSSTTPTTTATFNTSTWDFDRIINITVASTSGSPSSTRVEIFFTKDD